MNFSINIHGTWSIRQAAAVIKALEAETVERGVRLSTLEVTCHGDTYRKMLIGVSCLLHDEPLAFGGECAQCRELRAV